MGQQVERGRLAIIAGSGKLPLYVAEAARDKGENPFIFVLKDEQGCEALLAREKPNYDGAEPSGNSVAMLNLLRLAEFTTDDHYRQLAEKGLRAFSTQLAQTPTSMPRMLAAVDFSLDKPKEIVIVKPTVDATAEPLLAKLRAAFVPNRVLSVVTQGSDLERQQQIIPLLQFKVAINGKVTAYVCEQQACALPTADPAVFAQQIAKVEPLVR